VAVVNTLNSHPVLGSLALLNCHRPVYPLTFGGPDGLEDWSLADWCDQCHRKGGLVIGANPGREGAGLTPGETLADLVLGKVDALEILSSGDDPGAALDEWYGLLNCGFRVPLVAGSGKDSNSSVLGGMRTYARIQVGGVFTYRNWIEAVRAGRVFISNGPLSAFTVNGEDPGATVSSPAPSSTVRVRAEARSSIPYEALELVANGTVIGRAEASGSPAAALLEMELPCAEGGWLAARCRGGQTPVLAHTAPIYLQVAGRLRPPNPTAVAKLLLRLGEGLAWVEREGRFETDQQRETLVGIFQAAQAMLGAGPSCAS
jgi:hypothetical protein